MSANNKYENLYTQKFRLRSKVWTENEKFPTVVTKFTTDTDAYLFNSVLSQSKRISSAAIDDRFCLLIP